MRKSPLASPNPVPSSDAASVDGTARKRERAILLFVLTPLVIMAIVLHLWKLGDIPPGVHIDETSIGYNAYAILNTGADEHGIRLPIFFKAFGEYKSPVFIYTLVPLIKFFGLSVWTVRLGAALYGLGLSILLGLVVREATGMRYGRTVGFLLGALIPWSFFISRIGFEVVSFPFFLSLALWAWLRAIKARSANWFGLSWFSWGVSLFTYPTARLLVPLLILALLGCYARELRSCIARCLIGSTPFIVCLVLVGVAATSNQDIFTSRFQQISIWQDDANMVDVILQFASNYFSYLSPHFLFTSGDPNLRHHTGMGGELFLTTFPFLLFGLNYALRERSQSFVRFSLLGFFMFPLAASLTRDSDHALRAANAIPFVILLIVWGLIETSQLFRRRSTWVIIGLIMTLEGVRYYYDYFRDYSDRAVEWFDAGLPQALKILFDQRNARPIFYSLFVSRNEDLDLNSPFVYVQFLFFGKLNPSLYSSSGLAGFDIHPYHNGLSLPSGSLLLLKDKEALRFRSGKILFTKNPDYPTVGSEFLTRIPVPIRGTQNPPAFWIYRVP